MIPKLSTSACNSSSSTRLPPFSVALTALCAAYATEKGTLVGDQEVLETSEGDRHEALGLGDELVTGEAGQELLECHLGLQPGQRSTEAEVGAVAEGQVAGSATVDVEPIGVGELAVVEVGGAP